MAKPTGLVEPLKTLEAVLNLRNEWSDFLRSETYGFGLCLLEVLNLLLNERSEAQTGKTKVVSYVDWDPNSS